MTDRDSTRSNHLPPNLVANLQSVLVGRRAAGGGDADSKPAAGEDFQVVISAHAPQAEEAVVDGLNKPIVLVTNADGIGSPGITFLVEALVREGQCDVHVCAPDSEKSLSGHSITLYQTVAATSAEINGATAFEITGSPADCVSLALSGALYSWSKPALVISGINKGTNCGHHCFYSGAVAGAREALLSGVPSLVLSLNWKKDESKETDFKDAADVCLPLINAALRDINKGTFPNNCLLNIEIPTTPSANKGFKLTRLSLWRYAANWQGVSANRHPGQFMSMQQSLGIQLAQLGRDASAAGAARRIGSQRKLLEIESVADTGKPVQKEVVKKYFRLEKEALRKLFTFWSPRDATHFVYIVHKFLDKEQEVKDEDLDFRALDNGYIAVTPITFELQMEPEIQASASNWLATVVKGVEEVTDAA